MALSTKVKVAIFSASVLVGLIIIIGLVVHRTVIRNRMCENLQELYYEDPITNEGSCLKEGIQGPCGDNMVLVKDKRNGSRGVGTCQCDTEHFDRTLILNEEMKQCYFIFTQAYCDEGQWLIIDKGTKTPACNESLCKTHPQYSELGPELVPLKDGRCVELGKVDDNNTDCNASNVIRFFEKKIYPTCIKIGQTLGSIDVEILENIGAPKTDCPENYFSTGAGHCQPHFDFD